uniref:ABC-2 type transporter transmembrane domain-containing protein n=1 Tax=Oryza meridionalis TaxID=40149 RepID=A0A0E0EQW1_9ORYZ
MRAIRNTVDIGRIVVCTIHQPSIEIFESFDELFLMKQGGEEIYVGPIGRQSCELIRYFEAIQGVSKIKDGYNPSTWMLEVTSTTQEQRTCVDLSQIYKNSELYRRNKNLIKELSAPPEVALLFGTMFWGIGKKRQNQQTLFNIMGAMYSACMAMGVQNSSSVQPAIFVERMVFYRERASHMYSALSYALGQRIPLWWRWYYWMCPVAWTLNGLLTSQFGDVNDKFNNGVSVSDFIESYFGYQHDLLWVAAVAVFSFAILFAFLFGLSLRLFNFQKR